MEFAQSADEALERVATNDLDVIISDVSMPGKSGLDLLSELRTGGVTQDIPVIMLTGNAEADLKRKALDLEATDLINKPVAMEDLVARLRSALRLKSYQDQLKRQNEILEKKVRERTRQLEISRRDIVLRLAKAGEFRDVETGAHVIRVACCSSILATAAGVDEATNDRIFLTSPLHDIGKIGVPDGILLKPGKLNPDERKFIERHCEIGAAILQEEPKGMDQFLHFRELAFQHVEHEHEEAEPLRNTAVEIALTHHEHWNGAGYPRGLDGDDIPISGRIVAIVDMYDALRSDRPYKTAFDMDATLQIMREASGAHLDPNLFAAFEGVVDQCERIRDEFLD